MKKILFVLLFLFSLTFAEDICFSKNPTNNSVILENDCTEQLNAICSCSGNVCEIVPNEELVIKCIGSDCSIKFMSFSGELQVPIVNVGVFEYLCTSMVGSECSCHQTEDSIKCDIEKATVTFSYYDENVILKLNEYSKAIDYCVEQNEIEENDETDILIENDDEIIDDEQENVSVQENTEEEIEQNNTTCCGGIGLILILLGFAFYIKN